MAGPIHGRLECVFREDTVAHGRQEMFTTLYHFLKQHATLEALQWGNGGTGDGYWDDKNPVGLSGHFGDNAFAVFKFPIAGSRSWYWQLMIQFTTSAANFGTAPGDPGLSSGATTASIGIQAAVGIDGSGNEFDPWLGGKKTDGKARKLTAWSGAVQYYTGDRVMYLGIGYEALQANLNKLPTAGAPDWVLWLAAPTAWSATTLYSPNERVFYNNVTYVSISRPNYNRQPDISPTYWTAVTSGVWGRPPGVSGGSVYILPRSNNLPVGSHVALAQNCARITEGQSSGTGGTSCMHLFCDEDSLVIYTVDGSSNNSNIMAGTQFYLGPYTPIHGHKPARPFIMFGIASASRSDPLAAIYGGTTGGASQQGGVVTQNNGVRDVGFDRLTNTQTTETYEPNRLDSPPELGEYPFWIRVIETPGSDVAGSGLMGKIDTPIIRSGNRGTTCTFGRLNTTGRRVVVSASFAIAGTNATVVTLPWDGVTALGAGSTRYGTDYNP